FRMASLSMLVTRPRPDLEETMARLEAIGITAIACPLLTMQPRPAALPRPDAMAGLVATSANALRALDVMGALAPYRHLPVFAVGDKTASQARTLGLHVA